MLGYGALGEFALGEGTIPGSQALIPFAQYDWSHPQKPPPAKEPPTWSLNILTLPYPFNQYDWNRPRRVPTKLDQIIEPIPITLYANLGPFNQFQWPRETPVYNKPPSQSFPQNINLLISPFKARDKHDTGDYIPMRHRRPPVYEQEYYDELDRLQNPFHGPQETPPALVRPPPQPNLLVPIHKLIRPVSIPTLHASPPHRPVPSLTTNPPPFRMASHDEMTADDEMIIRMLLEE